MTPVWIHTDNNLAMGFEDFISTARQNKWASLEMSDRVRCTRAGLLLSILAAHEAANSTYDWRNAPGETLDVGAVPTDGYASPVHQLAAQTLLATLVLLAHGKKQKVLPVNTVAGLPATFGTPDVANIILIRLFATAIWAAAAAYIASEYEDTVDRALKRGEVGERLLGGQATLAMVVHDHAEKERQAGQSLPYAPEEKAVLDELIAQQKLFSATPDAPKDPPSSPLPSPTSFLGGVGIGALVIVGGLVWLLHSQKR